MASNYPVLIATTLKAPNMTMLGAWLVDSALSHFEIVGHGGVIYTYGPGIYQSNSCEYDFDLGTLSLTRSRWTRLVNTYLTPQKRNEFQKGVTKMTEADRETHTISLFFRELTKENHKERNHPWGGCLLALTYRGYPPTVILHSRTTRIGYTSFLDLAMAHVICRDIVAPVVGLPVSSIRFLWYVDLPQLSCIFILRYLLRHKLWSQYLRHTPNEQPWMDIIKSYRRVNRGKSKWGPAKRLYQDMQKKSFASVPVSSLGLSI